MAEWSDLADELDRWHEPGTPATLWWRDDDAVAPGARLERMLSIAGESRRARGDPRACRAAARRLARQLPRSVRSHSVLQHGWRHLNHARNCKKSEFSAERPRRGRPPSWPRSNPTGELFGRPPSRSWCRPGTAWPALSADLQLAAFRHSRTRPAALCPGPGLIEAQCGYRSRCMDRRPGLHRGRRGARRSCPTFAGAPAGGVRRTSRREF